MALPASSYVQLTPDLKICRVLNGLWQVSGAHGTIDRKKAIAAMFEYVDAGFTTWDVADHYGPAEDLIGEFRRQMIAQRGAESIKTVQALTKWFPQPGLMNRKIVEENITTALRRMKVESLDLMQFHWRDYQNDNYLEALKHIADLQQEGKIKAIALTNFDTDHLKQVIDAGIPIVANQVQYSIVDQRPDQRMAKYCDRHNIQLLAYGTLCGGLLSREYLGLPEPSTASFNTASLRKYRSILQHWGNWALFQELLTVLHQIGKKHRVSISNVAVRFVLERSASADISSRSGVSGAIVGCRLGISEHIRETAKVFKFALDDEDYQRIQTITERSRDLHQRIGDCGAEYRRS